MADEEEFTGLAPPGRDYALLPPLGTVLDDDGRAFIIDLYDEATLADWERRNAEFLATQPAPEDDEDDDEAPSNLSEAEEAELLHTLGLD